jgi:hypothetical protein
MLFRIVNNPRFFRPHDAGSAYFTKAYKQSRQFRATFKYNVMDDFEKAREQKVGLNHTLVDAGITHPHHLVANEVGKGQRLDTKQLAWLFVRPDFPEWKLNEILTAQKQKGVGSKEIKAAQKLAEEIRERMKAQGSEGLSLESPPLQLPSNTDQK